MVVSRRLLVELQGKKMINKFENLDTWIQAKELAIYIYNLTDKFPKSEIFSLTNQTNRAVVSISANIAEGCSRSSKKDFSHFLEIALGSAFELKTLTEIAYRRDYFSKDTKIQIDDRITKCVMLLYGLKRSLND